MANTKTPDPKPFGLKVEELEVGYVYEEVVSQRIVVVIEHRKPHTELGMKCLGLVYNPTTGRTEKVEIVDYQLTVVREPRHKQLWGLR